MKNQEYRAESFTGAMLWCMMDVSIIGTFRERRPKAPCEFSAHGKIYGGVGAVRKRKILRRREPGQEEEMEEKRERMIKELSVKIRREKGRETPSGELLDTLWEAIGLFAGEWFETAMHLKYRYFVHGNEIFVSRKDKSITRATVNRAFKRTLSLLESGCTVPGPKTIGGFGASYLYPVFIALKIIPEGQKGSGHRGRPRLDRPSGR